MRVALVYDRVNKWGGAERVLLALHELFPDAPLFTSVYNKELAPWANVFSVTTSFLQRFRFARSAHEYFALAMPISFEQFSFDEFDVVISVTSEAAKGIVTKPSTLHLCYCLTPTRYLWSGYEEYFSNPLLRVLATPAVSYLRTWDRIASRRPDVLVAISKEVQLRIRKFYQIESEVIYPPLGIASRDIARKADREKYFLVVSRLVSYKRIDLAIKACNELQVPLKIVGSGSEERRLKTIAGPTVSFLGSLTDEELAMYYKGCQALIFPGREDFGLTVLEAQLYGKPVIAYKAGGAVETVIGGKTGLFFTPQTIKALVNAMKRFQKKRFDPLACSEHAREFSKERFQASLLAAIHKAKEHI